eukprot:1194846-Prorocentrum_minimum.AAC.9
MAMSLQAQTDYGGYLRDWAIERYVCSWVRVPPGQQHQSEGKIRLVPLGEGIVENPTKPLCNEQDRIQPVVWGAVNRMRVSC